jgi:predicted MPP superfamily phosphohydrolase
MKKPQLSKEFFIIGAIILLFFSAIPRSYAAENLEIGFITDWEYHKKNVGNKLSVKAPSYLKYAIKQLNKLKPDMVIGGGDYIEGTKVGSTKAKEELKLMRNIFRKLDTDNLYYLTGNHDLRSLSLDQVKKTLKINYSHKIIDRKGFRIILLDTNFKKSGSHFKKDGFVIGRVSEDELTWLDQAIQQSPYPVIVFSHHSLARFKERQDLANDAEVRQVLEKSADKVLAAFSGHNPTQGHQTINGINYFIVNSLVDKRGKKSFANIEATKEGDSVTIEVKQYGTIKRTYTAQKTITINN